jgi:hypothetical protein
MSERPQAQDASLTHASIITCPACQHQQAEQMPVYSCVVTYLCTACGAVLQPLPGDCCVFCSFGSVPCPAIQAARHTG